ncbi:hypothetical protein BRD13_00220 [Halobacteriales archaeon SW_5_70_135]|nr:MAG: hypothetical protein BRD13_00220 [Halobacteriales archaeon SW_5_70_135]
MSKYQTRDDRRSGRAGGLPSWVRLDRQTVLASGVDVVGVERDEFPDSEAGVVGERDDRLVSVWKIRRDGVGKTHVSEVVNLGGL